VGLVGSVPCDNIGENRIICRSNDRLLQRFGQSKKKWNSVMLSMAWLIIQMLHIQKAHNSLLILSQVKLEGVGIITQNHNVDGEENILNHPSSPMSTLSFVASIESTSHCSGISDLPLIPSPATEP